MKKSVEERELNSPSGRHAAMIARHCNAVIHEEMSSQKITPAALASDISLNASSAYRYANGEINLSFVLVLQYCTYLGLKPSEVLAIAEQRAKLEILEIRKELAKQVNEAKN